MHADNAVPECSAWLTNCTLLILELNHLVDYDLHRGVSIEEVHEHIREGDVLDWLKEKFPRDLDLSLFKAMPERASALIEGLQALLYACAGDERRKWGVQHNGICLLIAWTNELVQQRVSKLSEARVGSGPSPRDPAEGEPRWRN